MVSYWRRVVPPRTKQRSTKVNDSTAMPTGVAESSIRTQWSALSYKPEASLEELYLFFRVAFERHLRESTDVTEKVRKKGVFVQVNSGRVAEAFKKRFGSRAQAVPSIFLLCGLRFFGLGVLKWGVNYTMVKHHVDNVPQDKLDEMRRWFESLDQQAKADEVRRLAEKLGVTIEIKG